MTFMPNSVERRLGVRRPGGSGGLRLPVTGKSLGDSTTSGTFSMLDSRFTKTRFLRHALSLGFLIIEIRKILSQQKPDSDYSAAPS